ncbi:MAG: phosphatase PAP2 family protein [Actinomycetota bacterium]|nr:phosphatase PAP2 family protein [Actinomycetota bacterium]
MALDADQYRSAEASADPGPRRRRFGLAWGRQSWWVEVGVIVFGYLLYEAVQNAVDFERALAYAHGRDVAHWQQWLHIDIDPSVNEFVNRFDWFAIGTAYYYNVFHYGVTTSLLIWLFLRRPDVYGRFRSALVVTSFGSLAVFWLYPVAPPRLAVPGIVDTAVVHHVFGTVAASSDAVVNDCAAMPSLHVGWAVWCAIVLISTGAGRRRWLALLYPVATTFVVIATGNHYLLDAVGGAVAVGVGLALTSPARPVGPAAATGATTAGGDEPAAVGATGSAAAASRRRRASRAAHPPTTAKPTGISAT